MTNKYQQFSKHEINKQQLFRKIHKKGMLACVRKRKFETDQQAIQFNIDRQYFDNKPYLCKQCGFWHTSSGKSNKLKIS